MTDKERGLAIDWVLPPFAGHLYPALAVARDLKAMGFRNQRILSTPSARIATEGCGLEFMPLLTEHEASILAIANTRAPVGASPRRLLRQFKDTLGVLGILGEEVAQHWRSAPPQVVIADRVLPTAGLAAEEAGVLWWTSMTSICPTETRTGVPAYLGGWAPGAGAWSSIRNAAGRAGSRSFKRAAAWLARRELSAIGLRRISRRDGSEAYYSGTKILAFGLREFEFPRKDWPSVMQFVGPALGSPVQSPPAPVIPEGSPHLLLTIGTHLPWAKERAARTAVELSQQLPGWTVHFSRGDVRAAQAGESPREISPTCFESPYIPYGTNLSDYAAIVHHGGSGISYAALSEGVPAAVWPHDYDQFDHAAQIEFHGLGLRTNGDPAALAGTIRRLVSESRFRERAEWMAERIASSHPASAVASALDGLRIDSE